MTDDSEVKQMGDYGNSETAPVFPATDQFGYVRYNRNVTRKEIKEIRRGRAASEYAAVILGMIYYPDTVPEILSKRFNIAEMRDDKVELRRDWYRRRVGEGQRTWMSYRRKDTDKVVRMAARDDDYLNFDLWRERLDKMVLRLREIEVANALRAERRKEVEEIDKRYDDRMTGWEDYEGVSAFRFIRERDPDTKEPTVTELSFRFRGLDADQAVALWNKIKDAYAEVLW